MRRLIAGAAIAVAVVIVLISILPRGGGGTTAPGASGASATVPPVPVSGEVLAEGRAIPARTASLEVPVPGTVVAIAELGATVAEGDDLIALDAATADAEIAVAEAALTSATAARDQARALMSQATAGVAAAEAGVDQAQASLRRTQAARELVPEDAEDARIDVAEADIDTAEAVVARAQAELDGAAAARNAAQRGEDVAEAERVRTEAALTSARLAREHLTVHAPFAGQVAFVGVGVGERAAPGLPLVRIADASSWTFETTDLGEEGVARISAGDTATITFDGQPGMQIAGRVSQIALFGQDRQGDVVYRVIVEPTGAVPATTRWNMTVTISIRPGS